MRLSDVQREVDRFTLMNSQALLQNGYDFRLTGMRDQMCLRTRRFDQGDDARKSISSLQPNALRPDPEYDPASGPIRRHCAN